MEHRILLLDIEVLQEKGIFPDPEVAERPIICITMYDNHDDRYYTIVQHKDLIKNGKKDGNHYIFYVDCEQELIRVFKDLFMRIDPDIVSGWNIEFDTKYIANRIDENIFDNQQIFDMMGAYSKIFNPRSKSLRYVAEKEGLKQKQIYANEIPELYKKGDIDIILEYNYNDVVLLKEIEDRHNLISFYISMKEYVGTPDINDCFFFSVLHDNIVLRMAKEKKVVLPCMGNNHGSWYSGAIVFDPIGGLHKNVIVLDMSKYYPNIILSFNISPDGIGLIPDMVRYFMEQRKMVESEMKKYHPGTPKYQELFNKRQVVKDLLNAVYGYIGYGRSRIYDKNEAEKVTRIARDGLVWVKKEVEKHGYKLIYGDTDSTFIKLPDRFSLEECITTGRELAEAITKSFDEFAREKGAEKHYLSLEFEKVYNPLLLLKDTKKRYAGKIVWEKGKETDYIQIRGMEIRRTDTAEITAHIQSNVIDMILNNQVDKIIPYLRSITKDIKEGKVDPRDLAINIGINKKLESYGITGGLPYHIRAVMYSNRYFGTKYDKGSKVKLLYIRNIEGYPPTDIIAFDDEIELPKITIDYDRMIDTVVRAKVEKLLDAVNLNWKMIKSRSLLEYDSS